jgi:hypothetical protein
MAEWNPWYDELAASQYSWFKVRERLEMNDVTHYVNVIEEFEEYSVNGCQTVRLMTHIADELLWKKRKQCCQFFWSSIFSTIIKPSFRNGS